LKRKDKGEKTHKPDETDLQILKELQRDARLTYTKIGKTLGIAHSTVYERIKKMERSGIIKKYTALLDPESFQNNQLMAIMTIFTDPKESDNVATKLCKFPLLLEVYTSLSEELLIIAKATADNQESLHSFIADSVAPMPGVLRIRTSIITKKFKETKFSQINHQRLHL
jgi:Lrp/AsnC family leucine-responsive transcriptional regulator